VKFNEKNNFYLLIFFKNTLNVFLNHIFFDEALEKYVFHDIENLGNYSEGMVRAQLTEMTNLSETYDLLLALDQKTFRHLRYFELNKRLATDNILIDLPNEDKCYTFIIL